MWSKKQLLVLVAVLVAGMSGLASADITATKDSADFTWKYEFNTSVLPDASDLDGNGVGDFNVPVGGYGHGGSISGGLLTLSTVGTENSYYYTGWNAGNKLWDVVDNLDYEHGVTVEMSVKVLAAAAGADGVTGLCVMPDGTNVDGKLQIAKTTQYWGDTGSEVGTGTYDNTDGFHAFRMALDPDTNTYSVWRDNELLGSGLGDTDSRDGLRRLLFGDFASGLFGDAEIDYVRITSGAYAPVPEPATLCLLGLGGIGVLLKRRR